jgi:hypothetical protein
MNTLRQPAVHYPGAPSHERMQHPQQPGPTPGQGSRPVLHLKKKNAPTVQSAADDATAGLGAAHPEVPESGHSM